jgi:MoaA/NifB/PqqE/SkfB family radical SAM enzyme
VSEPRSAVLAVTMGCQSRCTMCDIWQYGRGAEMRPEDYRRLPVSLREVNISGGEPFLRTDLVDIVTVIRERCPDARVVISTNALMPARIERMMERMRGVALRVSIDGYGEVDDVVRGIPGGFDKAVETLRRLKAAGHTDLGISATVSRLAVGELPALKKLANDEGVEFVCGVAHSSETYFGDQHDAFPWEGRQTVVDNLLAIREEQLRSRRVKDWFRAYFTDGLIDFVYNRPRRLFCHAGTEMFYLSPDGDVYPCNALNRKMGSLLADDYDTILSRSEETLEVVRHCPVDCWMSCTVAPAMRKSPWIPAWWIVGAKVFGRSKTPKLPDHALPERPRVHVKVTGPAAPVPITVGQGDARDDARADDACGSSK